MHRHEPGNDIPRRRCLRSPGLQGWGGWAGRAVGARCSTEGNGTQGGPDLWRAGRTAAGCWPLLARPAGAPSRCPCLQAPNRRCGEGHSGPHSDREVLVGAKLHRVLASLCCRVGKLHGHARPYVLASAHLRCQAECSAAAEQRRLHRHGAASHESSVGAEHCQELLGRDGRDLLVRPLMTPPGWRSLSTAPAQPAAALCAAEGCEGRAGRRAPASGHEPTRSIPPTAAGAAAGGDWLRHQGLGGPLNRLVALQAGPGTLARQQQAGVALLLQRVRTAAAIPAAR